MDRPRIAAWLGLIVLLPLAAAVALAPQGKGQSQEKAKGAAEPAPGKEEPAKGKEEAQRSKGKEDGKPARDVLSFLSGFTAVEARRHAVEAGLTGSKALPPGIVRNLARGKPLPPGIAQRGLPSHYLRKLPLDEGYDWVMAGLDLVLVSKADKLVREIYRDVFK